MAKACCKNCIHWQREKNSKRIGLQCYCERVYRHTPASFICVAHDDKADPKPLRISIDEFKARKRKNYKEPPSIVQPKTLDKELKKHLADKKPKRKPKAKPKTRKATAKAASNKKRTARKSK